MHEDWFKIKRYPHIGYPLAQKDIVRVRKFLRDDEKIAHYAFLPLIQRKQVSWRYKKDETTGKKRKKKKERPICFASHFDAQIYSFYAQTLEAKYEKYLREKELSDCVIAYRKIKDQYGKGKCNIDFACDIFSYIKNKASISDQCVIIADITSFFDSLNHRELKKAWKIVMGKNALSDAEYNIFRNVTQYGFVKERDIFNLFKDNIICKTKGGKIREKKVKYPRYMRDKNAIAYCRNNDMRKIREAGIIQTPPKNPYTKERTGIPQGLPISAVLANIYMISFDEKLMSYVSKVGGIYRRYSDDIVLIIPKEKKDECHSFLLREIENIKLDISKDKTKIFNIQKGHTSTLSITRYSDGANAKIEYLGLAFDGEKIRLKDKCLSHYYLKMRKSISRRTFLACHVKNKSRHQLFENKILRSFTPIGAQKRRIYLRDKKGNLLKDVEKWTMGNFWTYARKVARTTGDFHAIEHQLSRNKSILISLVSSAKEEISSFKMHHS